MGKTTGISWCSATWNPWMGCEKVSPGCDNCYMFREQERYHHNPGVLRRSKTRFSEPLKWQRQIDIMGGPTQPVRVFTCSWSDFFHKDADVWRPEAWDIIRATPDLTYQILTKRPSRILRCLPADWEDGYPNVWLGVSVESQEYVRRMNILADIPAVERFVSAEPLLGPLYLDHTVNDDSCFEAFGWVIVGGESDPAAPRPMEYEWARLILKQCRNNNVAFFFKQRSGYKPSQLDGVPDDLLVHEFPDEAREAA